MQSGSLCNPPPTWFRPWSGSPIPPRPSSSPARTPSPIPSAAHSNFTGWFSEQKNQLMKSNQTKSIRTSALGVGYWMFNVALLLLLAGAEGALAATHYVDQNSTNATSPYTSWTTAATNIQDAVGAAVAGDEIVVTNGTYAGGVNINKPLTMRSVNGPQFTTIAGGGPCVSLASNTSLSGFTVTGGAAG